MSDITGVSVSEDGSFFSFAFRYGYSIYSMNPVLRKLKKDFINLAISSISISPDGNRTAFSVKSIHKSDTDQKVLIWNNFYDDSEAELDFKEPIMSLCIRQNILIVVLRNSVCLYDLKQHEMMFEQVTATNEFGAGDISFDEASPKLAICGLVPGAVHITSLKRSVFVQAHLHPISIIKFSRDASIIATASDLGTLIRVFDSASGTLKSVFRRGALKSHVQAMTFSNNKLLLAVLSGNGTLHVFDMANTTKDDEKAPRAITKLKMDKVSAAEIVFFDNSHLCVITSFGVIHNLVIKDRKLSLTGSILALAH